MTAGSGTQQIAGFEVLGSVPCHTCSNANDSTYRDGLHHAGFAAAAPKYKAAHRGDYANAELASPLKSLFVWMDVFGVHDGDQVTVRLIGPDGNPLAERRLNLKLKRPRARQFLHFGFKARRGTWPAGAYQSEMILTRPASDGRKTFRASRRVVIR